MSFSLTSALIPQDLYEALLRDDDPRARHALREFVVSLGAKRIAIFGKGRTGKVFSELAEPHVIGMFDRESLTELANSEADWILVATSPAHYPAVLQMLEKALPDRSQHVALPFCEEQQMQQRKFYLLCFTSRSGSSFFADLLQSTGFLGIPREYFHPQSKDLLAFLEEGGTPLAWFEKVARQYCTANGVFGAKVDPSAFCFLRQTLGAVFDLIHPHYVWLRRRDTEQQAISLFRAVQTDRWQSNSPVKQNIVPNFSFDDIRQCEKSIHVQNEFWEHWFERHSLAPLKLWYEDDANDGGVSAVASHLGINLSQQLQVTSQRPVQRDSLTQEWLERYRHEKRKLNPSSNTR